MPLTFAVSTTRFRRASNKSYAVIPGLVPGIQLSAGCGACGLMDPGDKHRSPFAFLPWVGASKAGLSAAWVRPVPHWHSMANAKIAVQERSQSAYVNCLRRPRRLCSACKPSLSDPAGRQSTIDARMNPAAAPVVPRRRNLAVLTLSQALFMSVQGMAIATTPLAGYMLLGADEKCSRTVPIFLAHLGIMAPPFLPRCLMGVIGRRAGFTLGALLGVAFGAVGCIAIYQQSFPLLCLAALLQGMQAAFFWYFRLAAADATEPAYRAKAISLVMAGGVAAGFIGPQVAKWAVDWLAARDVRGRLRWHGRFLDRRAGARATPADSRGSPRPSAPRAAGRCRPSCASRPIAWRSHPRCSAMR